MMKLLVVLALLISVAFCDDFNINNVDARSDLAVRLSFNVSAQIDAAQKAELAKLQATLSADISGLIATVKAVSDSVGATIQSQITAAQASLQAAIASFVSQVVSVVGKVDGLALLVQQVGDARAAIQLECEDLQQAIQEGAVALQQCAKDKLQASLTENQKLVQLATQLPLLQAALLTKIGVDNAQAATNALFNDLALARAQMQVYSSLADQIQSFINNNTDSISKCRAAVQQRVAALALGITADWVSVRQVALDVATFKARITNIVTRIIGLSSINAFAVLDVQIDDTNHAIRVSVSISVTQQNNDQLKRILTAVCVAISGGNAEVVILPVSKRQFSASANVQITIQGGAQMNLASLNLSVQTDLSAAVAQYQAQLASNSAAINAQVTAFQEQLKTLTQTQIDAATAGIQSAFNDALQLWNTAQKAWNDKLTTFNTWVATAKQTILNVAAAVRDQAAQLLEVRKSQLDAKITELQACVDHFKANLQSFEVDEQTIKSAILSAQANLSITTDVNIKAEINATISLLCDMYQQKLSAAAIVKANLANLQSNLNASIALILAEEADCDAKLTAYKQKLANTLDNIKAHLAAQEDKIKARLQEVAVALDANIQSVQATFTALANSVSVSISVNFGATVTPDEVKAYLAASLQAEFGTDNVVVNVRSSTKRDAQASAATYDASIGASDGSASGPQGLSTAAIICIAVAAGVVVAIAVVVGVYVKRQKEEDNDYRQMRH